MSNEHGKLKRPLSDINENSQLSETQAATMLLQSWQAIFYPGLIPASATESDSENHNGEKTDSDLSLITEDMSKYPNYNIQENYRFNPTTQPQVISEDTNDGFRRTFTLVLNDKQIPIQLTIEASDYRLSHQIIKHTTAEFFNYGTQIVLTTKNTTSSVRVNRQ